jgi:DNA primase
MSVDTILQRLDKVRGNGKNSWMACCPAHDDRSPSLAISESSPDHILIKCFAGCEVADILSAIDLRMTDLFPETDQHSFIKTQPWQERVSHKQQSERVQELLLMHATIAFYEDDVKKGKKFTPAENKKYLDMFKTVQKAIKDGVI